MVARNAVIFKWSVYLGTMVLAIFCQGLVFQQIYIWGCIPFIYPVLVAVMATYDDMIFGATYGLILGVMCDVLLPAHIPCFYTLLFPCIAMLCAAIGKNIFPSGFLCSGVVTVLAFVLSGFFQGVVLWGQGHSAWNMVFTIMGRELILSFLLMIPLTVAFRYIAERTRYGD